MFESQIERKGRIGRIGWSVGLHVVLLLGLVHSVRLVRVRPSLQGSTHGTHMELTYLPGGSQAAMAQVSRKAAAVVRQKSKTAQLPTPAPALEAAAPSHGESGAASNDAMGTDDIQIALTTYSPSPKPDLSKIPQGTQGDVVLDVTIDPTGRVADLQILHALGYGVEGTVAETVRTWTFRPATKDGVPVASVQELHFHYGPV